MLKILKFWARIKFATKFSAYFSLSAIVVLGGLTLTGYARVPVEIQRIEVKVPVPEKEATLEELLSMAPAHKVRKVVAIVLNLKENRGKLQKEAKKCEFQSKEWLDRATKIAPNDPEQRDAYRCSYGPFQVAGWHAPEFGLVWSDLLNPRINAEVAYAVWAKCEERAASAKDKKGEPLFSTLSAVYRDAFRCYNGSGPAAEAYADDAMNKLGEIALKEMLGRKES